MKVSKNKKLTLTGNGNAVDLEMPHVKEALLSLQSLNHPTRKEILRLLQTKRTLSVTEIYEALDIEQSIASQHLGVLRTAGLVISERDGKNIFYSLNEKIIGKIKELISGLQARS